MQSHNSGFGTIGELDDVSSIPRQPIGINAPITAPSAHHNAGASTADTDLQPKPASVPAGLLNIGQFFLPRS